MSEVTVAVKRTGFPVSIGTVKKWFDTSAESLTRFFDIDEEATKRLNEYQKQVIEANLDKDIEEGVTKELLNGAIDLEKKYLEIQYDLIFGEGTFAELYELYPDFQALENTLETVCSLIANKLEELAVERETVKKKRVEEYTKKTKTARQKK